ncbi:hypothetical protein [Thermosipho globiformans]|nr:hypothetical protein [Thermosipho globiformans]
MAKKGQKFRRYPLDIKQEVIKLYTDEKLPKKTIASLLGAPKSR